MATASSGIAFEGESCAICKASASMMTTNVKGKTVAEAEQLVQEFRDMATGKLDAVGAAESPRTADGVRRRAGPAVAGEMRDPAVAHAACGAEFRNHRFNRRRPRPGRDWQSELMPKIADLEYTPNPNARKFVLKEPLTNGLARSFENAEQAQRDDLATKLFAIPHVTNVFYVDNWITVTQDGEADWQDLLREVAAPIREAPAAEKASEEFAKAAAWLAEGEGAADMSDSDRLKLDQINELLDEEVRPYPAGRRRRPLRRRPGRQHAQSPLPGCVRHLPQLDLRHARRYREPGQAHRSRDGSGGRLTTATTGD